MHFVIHFTYGRNNLFFLLGQRFLIQFGLQFSCSTTLLSLHVVTRFPIISNGNSYLHIGTNNSFPLSDSSCSSWLFTSSCSSWLFINLSIHSLLEIFFIFKFSFRRYVCSVRKWSLRLIVALYRFIFVGTSQLVSLKSSYNVLEKCLFEFEHVYLRNLLILLY